MQRLAYRRGHPGVPGGASAHVLFTGGPTANNYVEAEVMADYARAHGLPSEAILTEDRSHTTMQNIENPAAIVRAHGWNSVEVVSNVAHLPRAAVLLEKTGLRWRVHAAPTPGWSRSLTDTAFWRRPSGRRFAAAG